MPIVNLNTLDMAGFGSVNNALLSRHGGPNPLVGMGATRLLWTDRCACTVVEVDGQDRCKVQLDRVTRWQDGYGVEFAPDPQSPIICLRRDRAGRWREGSTKDGSVYVIGHRDHYRDPSF